MAQEGLTGDVDNYGFDPRTKSCTYVLLIDEPQIFTLIGNLHGSLKSSITRTSKLIQDSGGVFQSSDPDLCSFSPSGSPYAATDRSTCSSSG
ncbi:hypothetical protein WJX72_001242 [[Myrmecia] bisecta]|uniref:CUB domain-containing protein n=1 Tax=[Myrmecia] bisecta TaxID=41462 RepID=A0AAW1QQ90_9CHLO